MPFSGTGVFTRVYQWVQDAANGIFVDATRTDTDSNDIAAGLTNCVTRDGQSPWTANIPAGGFKITGLANGGNNTDSVNYGQVFNAPVFTSPSLFANPPDGDNSLKIPSTSWVNQVAFSAALPAQPGGTARYFLTSVGGIAGFSLNTLPRSPRTSNTELTNTDIGNLIDFTTGGFTQTFSASLTSGWWVVLRNSSTTAVTIPSSDGFTNWKMYPQESRLVIWDGSAFYTTIIRPFYYVPAASETFIWPPGYGAIDTDLVGGGGGGGSGRRGAAGTTTGGGAPGGAPGRVKKRHIGIAAGTNISLTIGAAGVGGAAQTVNSTDGVNGTAGGSTSFGTLSTAFGGIGGRGGFAGDASTSGSGSVSAGTTGGGGQTGGHPRGTVFGGTNSAAGLFGDNVDEGGAGSASTAAFVGGNSYYGGAGSGIDDSSGTTVNNSSGSSVYGVCAGSGGGWITSANTMPATASRAGSRGTYTVGGGALGGTCGASPTAGANGTAATNNSECGTSGAGGGSSATAAAAAGGNGGFPGGAGGGGGASRNGFNSGAGGNGEAGRAIIIGLA